ncbi:MAG: hypothetical protein L0F91_01510, partial [Lactococcus lactis]|nr:hypothetical protein [Lactococcus lactis]
LFSMFFPSNSFGSSFLRFNSNFIIFCKQLACQKFFTSPIMPFSTHFCKIRKKAENLLFY